MYVFSQSTPLASPIPGVAHATWAGQEEGLSQLSLWRQTLAPGAATPPHRHDCDEVVLCQSGWGELHIGGQAFHFGANSVVVLPRDREHQLFSVGPMPMELIGIFGSSPVVTMQPDGEPLPLPWRT